jgi:hypothetical protein
MSIATRSSRSHEARRTVTAARGYRHPLYAASLAGIGTPLALDGCRGWLIERSIPDSAFADAIGIRPRFDCVEWSRLGRDLSLLSDRLVSVTLVTDPFAAVVEPGLREIFDVVTPFKRHYLVDLDTPLTVGRRHRRNLEYARKSVTVHACDDPSAYLDEWCGLYALLLRRHGGGSTPELSREAFERQLCVPGLTLLRACEGDTTIGLHLWYDDGLVARGHLGATSARGYELRASYALYAAAIDYFRGRLRWLDLGGVAGDSDTDPADGLRQFKSGWATATRQSFLCGRVLQPETYACLVRNTPEPQTPYFPRYRYPGVPAPLSPRRPTIL